MFPIFKYTAIKIKFSENPQKEYLRIVQTYKGAKPDRFERYFCEIRIPAATAIKYMPYNGHFIGIL
jgi:hypothetical protein